MRTVRLLLVLVLVASVAVDGLRGLVVGIAIATVVELLSLRFRFAGAATAPSDPPPLRPVPGRFGAPVRPLTRPVPLEPPGPVPVWRGLGQRLAARLAPAPEPPEPFPGLGIGVYPFDSLREFDLALRHRLSAAAAAVLADRHGVDLHAEPARARRLLGDDAWWLLDPARPVAEGYVPFERNRLERVVAAIEEL